MPEKPEKPREIPLRWEITDEVPVAACNVFVAQFTHGEFTLTFGYASPPIHVDSSVQSIQPKVVARLSLSPTRMQELVTVLKGNIENFQQAQLAAQTVDKIKH